MASDPGFPPVVLAHMGSVEEGDAFLAERWPEARAIAAAGTELHQAFGLGRARFRQLFGLAVLRATPGALRHGASRPVGDPFQLAGHFLVADGAVRLRHPHAHVGEALDLDAIAAAAS